MPRVINNQTGLEYTVTNAELNALRAKLGPQFNLAFKVQVAETPEVLLKRIENIEPVLFLPEPKEEQPKKRRRK